MGEGVRGAGEGGGRRAAGGGGGGGGGYLLHPVVFRGPCKGFVEVRVAGVVRAPAGLDAFRGYHEWINFAGIDGLLVTGGGTFDGRGASSWHLNDCPWKPDCVPPPSVSFEVTRCRVSKIQSEQCNKNLVFQTGFDGSYKYTMKLSCTCKFFSFQIILKWIICFMLQKIYFLKIKLSSIVLLTTLVLLFMKKINLSLWCR